MKYDVFISYSRKDSLVAERICKAFDGVGIKYFIDLQGIAGGFEFPVVLAEAILESKVILFLASENSYESKFTNAELTFAFNEKPKNSILPYIIDGSTMPPALRFVFSSINWRTIYSHPIESTLVEDILRMLGRNVEPQSEEEVAQQPIKETAPKRMPEPKTERGELYDVVLHDVGSSKLTCVKTIKETLDCSLREAKDIADSAPIVVLRGVGKERADECMQDFDYAGANVECRKCKVSRYKVGDLYDDLGKRGVVFEVSADGRYGKIVSLEQSEPLEWCADEDESQVMIEASDADDGMANMNRVKWREEWRDNYPAFAWCDDLGKGWYLPATEELKKIVLDEDIRDTVNATIRQHGGDEIFTGEDAEYYWSSTEVCDDYECDSAWNVYTYEEYAGEGTDFKNEAYYARAVSLF